MKHTLRTKTYRLNNVFGIIFKFHLVPIIFFCFLKVINLRKIINLI